MSHNGAQRQGREHGHGPADAAAPASKIGAGTLVQALGGAIAAPESKVGGGSLAGQLGDGAAVQQIAAAGTAGAGGPLPHGDAIQRAFGHHDIGGVQAHSGGDAQAATRALGAEAYASGQHVAFAGAPSLHTAAHEAAHVVQQRGGIQLKGGVGAAGDAHEQHADAVADAVVQGRSAEGLLDPYGSGPGGGGGGGVQLQPAPEVAPDAAPAVDVKALTGKLGRIPVLAFDLTRAAFDIDAVTAWIELFVQTVDEVKIAAGGNAPPELAQTLDRCVGLHVPGLQKAAEEIRTATVKLTNDSSVAKQDPAKAVFPTQAQVKKLGDDAGKLNQLSRDPSLSAGAAAKTAMQTASATAQDAALAMLQSLSVIAARDRWKTGKATETPSADKLGKGPRTELDEIYKDAESGLGDRASLDEEKGRAFDWCGIFVASSLFKGGGLAKQLHAGFNHTDNVQDFFHYEQKHNDRRVPMSIWAESQWWNLKEYHLLRGTARQWTTRAQVQAALTAGTADIRPGDTCLIDHKGGNAPSHIVMVESFDAATKQLVTIEGNTFGIHADKDGKAERIDDEHLKHSAQGKGTATGLHVRDMNQLAPGPGTYVVIKSKAYVREDDEVTRYKKEDGKKVMIPVDSDVEVTEIKEVGGAKYANVKDWGWTSFGNLNTTGKLPKGAYKPSGGATVWGVGRPSMVDFEDGHEYGVHQVPEDLRTTSPAEMRELAKQKGKQGAAVKKIGLK
jgi:hypothetical protein